MTRTACAIVIKIQPRSTSPGPARKQSNDRVEPAGNDDVASRIPATRRVCASTVPICLYRHCATLR